MNIDKLLEKLKHTKINKNIKKQIVRPKTSDIVSANEHSPKVQLFELENYNELLKDLSQKVNLAHEKDILSLLSLIFYNENYFDQHTIRITSAEITPSQVVLNYQIPNIGEADKLKIQKDSEEGFLYEISDEAGRTFRYHCQLTPNTNDSDSFTTTTGNNYSLTSILRYYREWDEKDKVFSYETSPNKISIRMWNCFYVKRDLEDESYCLTIEVEKPEDEEEKTIYELPNQEQLLTYLQNLDFPVNLDEIYKQICLISLGEDISKYPLISMNILTQKYLPWVGYADGMFTDMISLTDGVLTTFGLTHRPTNRKENNLTSVFLHDDNTISYVHFNQEHGFKIVNNTNLENATNDLGKDPISYVSVKALNTFPEQWQNVVTITSNTSPNNEELDMDMDTGFIQMDLFESEDADDKTYSSEQGPQYKK